MPRKSLKERQKKKYVRDTDNNRIRPIIDSINGLEDPDDIMQEILEVIKTTQKSPTPGSFCVFVYNPKTIGIQYDEYPFVAVTDIFQWGFRGINFHWGRPRQYTFMELVGNLYEVRSEELNDLRTLPFAKIEIS